MNGHPNLPDAIERARRDLRYAMPGTPWYADALDRLRTFEEMAGPDDQIDEFTDIATETRQITAETQRDVDAAYETDVAISRTTTARLDGAVVAGLAQGTK